VQLEQLRIVACEYNNDYGQTEADRESYIYEPHFYLLAWNKKTNKLLTALYKYMINYWSYSKALQFIE
jgi:hypothetical protein